LFTEVRADLGILVGKMKESVKLMLNVSSRIDWSNCELALSMPSRNNQASSTEVLIPPTPPLMENIKSDQTNPKSTTSLQLLSPTPCKSGPSTDPITTVTVTPVSTGQVMRRFPRLITTDQSPLLRQSLMQSTRLRVEDNQRQSQDMDSRSSVCEFSPGLSSTAIHRTLQANSIKSTSSLDIEVRTESNTILNQVENPGPFSTTAACSSFGSLRDALDDDDATQTKIDEYKKILLSAKSKEQPDGDSRSSLLHAWNNHRQSLSPQTPRINLSICSSDSDSSPPTLQYVSPKLGDRTTLPDISNKTPDMTRRLDQLMSSLTFSDTSLDLSLGKMSLGGEELLSPHCP